MLDDPARGLLGDCDGKADAVTLVQSLIDGLPDNVAILDPAGRIVATNLRWNAFSVDNGGAGEAYLGDDYLDVCRRAASSGDASAVLVAVGVQTTLATGRVFKSEYPCDSPTERRWFELIVSPFGVGENRHVVVSHRNITPAKIAVELEHDFAIIAHASAIGAWATIDALVICGLQDEILLWSKGAVELFGYSAPEAMLRSINMLYLDIEAERTVIDDDAVAGRSVAWETICTAKDGRKIPAEVHATPLRNGQGEIYATLLVHRDMSGYAERLTKSTDANRELAHRIKNLLTVVSSLITQTARTSPDVPSLIESFSHRISGMSRSVDLLLQSGGGSVSLREIARRHLEAFVPADDPRIVLALGDVAVAADAVHAIGMALHELATNATKYGALSVEDGVVSIALDRRTVKTRLVWTEKASSIVAGPASPGFGSSVLTRMTERVLGGPTRYERLDGRLIWSVEISDRLIAA